MAPGPLLSALFVAPVVLLVDVVGGLAAAVAPAVAVAPDSGIVVLPVVEEVVFVAVDAGARVSSIELVELVALVVSTVDGSCAGRSEPPHAAAVRAHVRAMICVFISVVLQVRCDCGRPSQQARQPRQPPRITANFGRPCRRAQHHADAECLDVWQVAATRPDDARV
jgi:hypothetical protein